MGRWGRCAIVTHSPQLEFLQLLLEVADISPSIPDITVDSSLDRRVVGGLSHVTGGIDESLLPLDLLVDVRNRRVCVSHPDCGHGALFVTFLGPC